MKLPASFHCCRLFTVLIILGPAPSTPAVDQARVMADPEHNHNQGDRTGCCYLSCASTVLQLLWDIGRMTHGSLRKRVAGDVSQRMGITRKVAQSGLRQPWIHRMLGDQ